MGIHRELAILAMKATTVIAGNDFLRQANIETPVPPVPGVLPAVAREPFWARHLKRSIDLLVIFTIGDFAAKRACSEYYNPKSAWYNVFYGAYGIRSYKADGTAWGYDRSGQPNLQEMLEVPCLDYNFLTAGELGCPPHRMCFEVKKATAAKQGQWDLADVRAKVPSGLHAVKDAVDPDPSYYVIFGVPDHAFLRGRQSYEPVDMHGQMFFRKAAPGITLVWGGMCPDTPAGNALLKTIIDAMSTCYL